MTERETHTEVLGTPRKDRPLIAPYQLEGSRRGFPGDTYRPERFTVTVPTLAYEGEEGVPLYVEAKLRMTTAELDILIGQLNGIRAWLAEEPRNYRADADFLVEQGIFTGGSGNYYLWADRRDRQRYNAEQAVDAYENEEDGFTVAELHEQRDDDLVEDPTEDGLTAHTIYQRDEN